MNKIELLQKAQTESVPVLRRVTEHFRQLFPELKLRPNALERTPNADTFMTTNLQREDGEIRSIVNDFVNIQTQKTESKIQSRICDGIDGTIGYNLQELGQKGEVTTDLDYVEGCMAKLKNFEYGAGDKPIKETLYDTMGNKQIIQRDELGNTLSYERIPNGFARTKTIFNSDGSQVTSTYQQVTRFPMKGDKGVVKIGDAVTTEERNAQGQLVKITRSETNWDNKYESLIELNPEGRIVKFSLPGAPGARNMHLEAEYTPNGFSCKSYKLSQEEQEILNVVFDETTGKPMQASGHYVDVLRKKPYYSEEEIMKKLHFNPVIYDNTLHFRLGQIEGRDFDHTLLDLLPR